MNVIKVKATVFCQDAEWAQARGEKVQPVAFCFCARNWERDSK